MNQPYRAAFEPTTAERVARNDAIFREANERIREAAEEHDHEGNTVPFICECANPACRELLQVSLSDYERVRAHPARFLIVPGHEGTPQDPAEVVAQRDGHVVVEKRGEAGEVAEKLADRPAGLVEPRHEE